MKKFSTKDSLSQALQISSFWLLACVLLIFSGLLSAQDEITQIQKLLAGDAEANDVFGYSVSVSGATAIVSAASEDEGDSNAGAVYIFEQDENGVWQQSQKLLADDAEAGDQFGVSVSVSGATAIVGAFRENEGGDNAGAAYVFEQDENGVWQQSQKLLADDAQAGDQFGVSVSVSGATAIVGANWEDEGGDNAGAAYVFEQDENGVWQQSQKLLADDAQASDRFGYSVSVSGATAIVGAYQEDEGGSSAGAAYVFEQDENGVWQQTEKLLADDAQASDHFGVSVSVSGATAIVGAHWEDDGGSSAGAAYVFEQDENGVWQQSEKLLADDAEAGDRFGISVSVSGATAIVGAYLEDDGASSAGAAYLFSIPADDATPAGELGAAIDDITGLLNDPNLPPAAGPDLQNANDDLQDAIDDLNGNDVQEAYDDLEDAMNDLMDAADDGADVQAIIDAIIGLADDIVSDAQNSAAAFAGNPQVDGYIDDANDFYQDYLDELAAGDYNLAIRRLANAHKELQRAIHLGSAIAQGMDAEDDLNTSITNIQELIDTGGFSGAANADLEDAIEQLEDAIADFNDGEIKNGYNDLQDAVEQLQDAEADGADAANAINEIVDLAKMMAEVKLTEAQAYAGNPAVDDKIADAEADMADADTEIAAGDHDAAVKEYRDAWEDARIALEHGRGLRKDDENGTALPTRFALEQNYPNPFNPATTIKFALPEAANVTLKIYNITGQLVNTLVNENMAAGYHNLRWNGKTTSGNPVASGLYFYHLKAGNQFEQVRKMMLIK